MSPWLAFILGLAVGQGLLLVVGIAGEYLREKAAERLFEQRNHRRRQLPPEHAARVVDAVEAPKVGQVVPFAGRGARKTGWIQ